ncbi:hypothetical protein CALVIDRAFT_431837 [Calocera viscosa TUFC12733]|uniref:Uncharacterized protein n=1 Tax=Calocera viscosa (strain TUFC12733) TaxID=1330018 RepID=A0A167FYM3_CALVF|nr:hypothetical protein CALVIDRAFT_431837 [Calocera viscosa TUFC12733]
MGPVWIELRDVTRLIRRCAGTRETPHSRWDCTSAKLLQRCSTYDSLSIYRTRRRWCAWNRAPQVNAKRNMERRNDASTEDRKAATESGPRAPQPHLLFSLPVGAEYGCITS